MSQYKGFEPWGHNILIRQDAGDKVSKGGIVLPEEEKPNTGEVVAVGPGRKHGNGYREPMAIKPGWRVHYPVRAAQEITVDGETLHIIDENGIYGICVKS